MSFGGNMFEYVKNGLNASICPQKSLDFPLEPPLGRSPGHRRADLSAAKPFFKPLLHGES